MYNICFGLFVFGIFSFCFFALLKKKIDTAEKLLCFYRNREGDRLLTNSNILHKVTAKILFYHFSSTFNAMLDSVHNRTILCSRKRHQHLRKLHRQMSLEFIVSRQQKRRKIKQSLKRAKTLIQKLQYITADGHFFKN